MSTFIVGGSCSGKSMWAQRIASAGPRPLHYVATMLPRDAEDEDRIRRHRHARAGWGFETIECGRDILSALDGADAAGSFLVDSVTALLANAMFDEAGFHPESADDLCRALDEFIRRAPNAVLVSDDIFSSAAVYDATTEAFRAGLARIARHLAEACDNVLEAAAGQIIVHKGVLPL